MKGIVFNLLGEAVQRTHGENAWDDILAAAAMAGAFTSLGTYPDEAAMRLVGAAAEKLGLSPAEVVRWFGREAAGLFAERYGRKVSVVLFDLDHFKELNDRHGHPFGDMVLQVVGELLWAELRAADAPCRWGGEEFAIILTETDLAGARTTAERMRRRIAALDLTHRGARVPVTASFGVACAEQLDGVPTATALVRLSDDALYQAKRAGRNRVCTAEFAAASSQELGAVPSHSRTGPSAGFEPSRTQLDEPRWPRSSPG